MISSLSNELSAEEIREMRRENQHDISWFSDVEAMFKKSIWRHWQEMYSRTTVVQSATENLRSDLFNQLSAYCNEYKMRRCSSHQSVLSKTAKESQEWNHQNW